MHGNFGSGDGARTVTGFDSSVGTSLTAATPSIRVPQQSATARPAGVAGGHRVEAADSVRGRVMVGLAAVGGLGAFVATAFAFPDPLAGASTAGEMAARLADSNAAAASRLMLGYAVCMTVVVGSLSRRVGTESGAARLVPVLGVAHLILMAAYAAGPAAAIAVGTGIFDGVTPGGAETALILSNSFFPLAQFTGVAFLVAVAATTLGQGRLRLVGGSAAVFAAGLLVPPIGWAVVYLSAFWFAGVGIRLAVKR